MGGSTFFHMLSVIAAAIYVVGLFYNLNKNNKNDCDMTYMFEYSQFVRVHVPENQLFIQYRLYAYSEGRFTERARKMRFDGIPVLFLPGNAGSHKQVRSLASVALRKAISTWNYNIHFDYFTVDFNEELSGIFGGVLHKQTQFARYCLKAILGLYNKDNRRLSDTQPRSVVIVGHSMGGLIAKGILNNSTVNDVNLIITLAAPLEDPIINLDHYINSFYLDVANLWKNVSDDDNKVLISLGGGSNDLLMPSAFISSPAVDLQALTTSIPGVWMTTDHRSILWCRQLVLTLNKFLFSIIDTKTKQITLDQIKIIENAKYYIKSRKMYSLEEPSTTPTLANKQWHEDSQRKYNVQFTNGVKDTLYYMIRLVNLPNHQYLTAVISEIETDDWLFGCTALDIHGSSRVCSTITSIKQYTSWLAVPRGHGKKQKASFNLHTVAELNPKWTHVIIKLPPSRKPVQLNIDVHNKDSRFITVHLPYMCSHRKQTIVSITEPEALRYEIEFPGFENYYQAYFLYVEPIDSCGGNKYHVSAEMLVPWAEGHEVHHHFTEIEKRPMRLILMKEKMVVTPENVTVSLFLDQKCRYKISYSGSLYESVGQFSRHYTTSIIPIAAMIIVMTARATMISVIDLSKYSTTLYYYKALWARGLEPYYLIVLFNLFSRIMRSEVLNIFTIMGLADEAVHLVLSQPFSVFVLPFFQYLVALGAIDVLAAVAQMSLLLSGQIAHKVLVRMVWRGPCARGIAGIIRRIPGFAAAVLMTIAPASCGAVALAAGGVFYFFMLTKMYEDFLEEYFYRIFMVFIKRFFTRKVPETSLNKEGNSKGKVQSKTFDSKNKENVPSSIPVDKDITELKINSVGISVNKSPDTINNIAAIKQENQDIREIPNIEQSVPDIDQETSNMKNLIPDFQEAIPNANAPAPDIQETTANVDTLLSDGAIATITESDSSEVVKDEIKHQCSSPDSSSAPVDDDIMGGLHFHFMMFTLWCVITAMNIPSLITWAHNFKYNMALQTDPSFVPGLILIISAGFLWQIDKPRRNLKYWSEVNTILYAIACLILLLDLPMLFVTNYLLSLVFALITLHQMFAKEQDSNTDVAQNNNSDSCSVNQDVSADKSPFEHFSDLKDKLETTDMEA